MTHPRSGHAVYGDAVDAMVQAYDTSSPVASLSAVASGPGGTSAIVPMSQEGVSLWRADVDVSSLPAGMYDLTVSGAFADGQPTASATS